MRIRKHPTLNLWLREDGAVCLPPSGKKYKKFRWTFGCPDKRGYLQIRFRGKQYRVHRLICQTFHGLAPEDNLTVDHINRNKLDNRPENLRWADCKMQQNNRQVCENSLKKYGVCKDKKAYWKAQKATLRAKQKALGKHYRHCPDGKRRYLTDSEFAALYG